MKNLNKNLIKSLVITLVALATLSSKTYAASTSGDADVQIVSPLAISQSQGLNFGIIAPDASSSSTVDQDGNVTGGAEYISGSGAQKGIFSVTGYNNSAYDVTIPASVTLNSGGDSMSASLSVFGGTAQSLSSGSGTFDVNGTLTVGAAQANGNYTGSYTVEVNYN